MDKSELTRPWWLLPAGRLDPRWWIGIAVLLIWADLMMGPNSQFPVVYVIPVILAAWYSGRFPALALAVVTPLAHLLLLAALWKAPGAATLALQTTLRGAVIMAMALWFARLSEHERAVQQHVRALEGLLCICSFCKSIRNDAGEWERLESYISDRSDTRFSHGFCPVCQRTHYPDQFPST
jgi:hypothetical protein